MSMNRERTTTTTATRERRDSGRSSERRERSRERDKEDRSERDRDRGRERDKDRDRSDRDRERDRDRDRERGDRDRDRDRGGGERDRDREKDRDRDRDRWSDRDNRDRDRDRRRRSDERDKDRKGRSRSRDRRRRSSYERRRHRSDSDSDSSPIPEIKRRKKTGWDVMIPEETVVAPPPVVASMNPQQQRQQKRLYVGNLPATVSEIELMEFFNTAMANANVVAGPGSPVLSATINREKAYAFIEFRSAEEASSGMSLDGITLQGHALRVRRPKDYQPMVSELPGLSRNSASPSYDSPLSLLDSSSSSLTQQGQNHILAANLNIVSTNVADTPYKIFIGGLPTHLNEGDVKKLLSMFGQLKSFNLVRDSLTGLSKGFAFCEYADPNMTDTVCASLNGMAIGDKTLIVQRASVNPKTKTGEVSKEPINPRAANMLNLSTPAAQLLATAVKNATADPTKVLVLMNIINLSDFPGDMEEGEYAEFIEDITEECQRYGKVVKILVPRPTTKQKNHTIEHFDGNDVDIDVEDDEDEESEEEPPPPPGFGKVFVEYEKVEHAKRAQTALSGRRYDGRMVITSFHPEEKWAAQILEPDEIEPVYMPLVPPAAQKPQNHNQNQPQTQQPQPQQPPQTQQPPPPPPLQTQTQSQGPPQKVTK